MRPLDPIGTAQQIDDAFTGYLKSTFGPRRTDFRADFERVLDESELMSRGPFLEATAPFAPGRSIDDLIGQGVLRPEFRRLQRSLPLDRPLYRHQEQAVEKAVTLRRNLVVSTGTGSGKTEAFLIPILEHLLGEIDEGTIDRPGVRALLLYPMNALANDQIKRLRSVLREVPEITFGRYTGETKPKQAEALEDFRQRSFGKDPLPNELISREAMQAAPPHILLTNYAMLEYLLLRPADTPFFDGATAQHWRFLVLDEAHVYNGAQGTEIAYLLRRLRDRVARSERGRLQCFALSATLGKGADDHPALVEFASQLFDEPFEWETDDPSRQDVVAAERLPLASATVATHTLTADQIATLHDAFRSGASPEDLARVVSLPADPTAPDAGAMLHHLLATDGNVLAAQAALTAQSRETTDLATDLFPDEADREQRLVQLIDLAVNARARDGEAPLIPARYHHFVRSLDGAFVCLHPHHPPTEPRITLARHSHCHPCRGRGVDSVMFELAICRRCRAEYLVGVLAAEDGIERLRRANDFDADRRYFLLGDPVEATDEDEETLVDDAGQPVAAAELVGKQEVCAGCGAVVDAGASCACTGHRVQVTRLEPPSDSRGAIRSCASCSARTSGEMLARFVTGTDAPVSVIATELYQQLPPTIDDGAEELSGGGRKLLAFADSRQDAAFFAGYLERTYGRSLHRALMFDVISASEDALRTTDLVDRVTKVAEQHLVLDPDDGRVANRARVSGWITEELLAFDRRQSLEGTGLVRVSIALPRKYRTPDALLALGLSSEQAGDLVQLLLGTLRSSGAITMLDGVDIRSEEFAPRNHEISVRGAGAEPGVLGWSPAPGSSNRRLDILEKVISATGATADPRELLQRFWNHLTDPTSAWKSVVAAQHDRKRGPTWRIDSERFEFRATGSAPGPYRCTRCATVTWWNVAGVCPAWKCPGSLEPVNDHNGLTSEHYARLYQRLEPISLTAEEHTAQWSSTEAASVQERFVEGDVNVLSCSTTFEMGVDVGDLQAVLLRNVPPGVANYVQRAGRAGRRVDAAALVVTFAQRRNHDRTFFEHPQWMIEGTIAPPAILLDNVHIARRHVHSVAFAQFLRRCVDAGLPEPTTVGEFFAGNDDAGSAEGFASWLRSQPPELQDAVSRVLPRAVGERLGVTSWDWVPALLDDTRADPSEGWFARACDEVAADLEHLSELRADALAREDGRALERYKRLERTVRQRPLIGYLSSRNVLPKYGFPVDVVELNLRGSGNPRADKLDLSRDLALAISDYAPGNEVVAGKQRWLSTGLARRPDHSWPTYGWAVCAECGAFRRAIVNRPPECHVCGSSKLAPGAGTFVVPIYGFLGRSVAPAGESRPPRTGFAVPYFTTDDVAEFQPVAMPSGSTSVLSRVSRQGRITLINSNLGAGFSVCEWCGWAGLRPQKRHEDPRISGRTCTGPLRTVHLGHEFLTDVLELRFEELFDLETANAALFALIESSGEVGINREEVNGTTYVHTVGSTPGLVLFDAVPGGAGHCQRLLRRLPDLIEAAYRRVAECACDLDASCYSCLRSYRNQRMHEQLRRGDARRVLEKLLTR